MEEPTLILASTQPPALFRTGAGLTKSGTSSVTPVPGPRSPTRQSVSALRRKINEGDRKKERK